MKTITVYTTAITLLALTACSSMPRNTGTSYDCNRGTKLKVDYIGNGAIVRVNGRNSMVLKQTPSTGGAVYENKKGARLQRNGNEVTWNTALRSAPESCRTVNTPL
ncbi:MliC family protein [Sphingopyxis sp. JAI128]|uniref:MliC family protein n=1 Tax=Sphingopyxis sp. JAI128 TaxID=2723066 RepID=UPI00161414A7|nr:MliC family protein [Sphingopyxis sp. JAI128]MBB6426538.1 membrane-bound inhibitor of C-type lysozyme [Sphingopyxis sp. JAI128]